MNIGRKIFSMLVVLTLVSTIIVFKQTSVKAEDPEFISDMNELDFQIGDILQIHSNESYKSWNTSYWIGELTEENESDYKLNIGIPMDEYWVETFLCIDNSSEGPLFIHSNSSGVIVSNATEIWNSHDQLIDNWAQLRVNESFDPDDVVSFANDKLNRSYDNWSITHTTKQINITNSSENNYGYYDTELIWATFMNTSSIDLDPDEFIDDDPSNFSWVTPSEIYECPNTTMIFIHDSENMTDSDSSYEDIDQIIESSDVNYVISKDLECTFRVNLYSFPKNIIYEDGIEDNIGTKLLAIVKGNFGFKGLYEYYFNYSNGLNDTYYSYEKEFDANTSYSVNNNSYEPIIEVNDSSSTVNNTINISVTEVSIEDWIELPPISDTDVYNGLPDFDQRQNNWKNKLYCVGKKHWTYCQSCAAADAFWWLDAKREKSMGAGSCGLIDREYGDDYHESIKYNVEKIRSDVHNFSIGRIITPDLLNKGLDRYLEDENEDENYIISNIPYDFNRLKEEIAKQNPVLLWFKSLHPDWGWKFFAHWVAVSGAGTDLNDNNYIRVSDPIFDCSKYTNDYTKHNFPYVVSHDLWKVTDGELNDYSLLPLFPLFPGIEGYGGRAKIKGMLIITDKTSDKVSVDFNGYTSGIKGNNLPFTLNLTGGTETFDCYINFDDGNNENSTIKLENQASRNFSLNYTYSNSGTYNIVVAVRDEDGNSDPVEVIHNIEIVEYPYVEMEVDRNPSLLNRNIKFTATHHGNGGKEYFYKFNFGDGSNYTAWDTDGDGKMTASHSYTADNDYNASVKIYNRSSLPRTLINESDIIKIHAYAFIVDASGPYYGWENEEIEFNGYTDGLFGWGIRPKWDFGDGNNSSDLHPSHAYEIGSSSGTVYNVNFSIESDDKSHYNLTTATVYNGSKKYPTANITATPSCGALPGQNIVFDASDSSDQYPGSIIQYDYKIGSDPWLINKSSSYTHSFKYPHTYNVKVRVHDNTHLIDTAELNITVTEINADFYCSPSIPTDIQNVTFNDNSDPNPCKTVNDWYWDFGDGNTSTDEEPEHQYADDGYYLVKLRVEDSGNNQDTIYKGLYVRNVPPVTQFNASVLVTVVGENISFNTTSYDFDGEIIEWKWYFGDDNTSTSVNTTHNYSNSGFYTPKLRTKDDDYDTTTLVKENRLLIADAIVSNGFDENTTGWNVTRFDNIQDGIDAVPDNGILVVLDRDYNNDTGFLINKTMEMYAVQKGYNQSDTEIQYGDVDLIGGGDLSNTTMLTITASDVYVKGFTIKSGKKGIKISNDNTTIEECTVSYNNMNGIELLDISNITVKNCTITYNNDIGIMLNHSDNSSILECNITKGDIGIFVDNNSEDNSISDCEISQNDIGIDVNQSDENQIADCEISQNDIGIDVNQSDDNYISDCEIKSNDDYGIHLVDSVENTIYKSDIWSNDIGVYIVDCLKNPCSNIINRCNMSYNSHGVYLYNSSYTWIGKGYAESQFYTEFYCNDIAIYLNESDKNTIQDCDINATTCCQSIPCIPTKGIYFNDSISNNILNVIVEGADKNGINIANSSINTIEDCRMTKNYYGIRLDNSSGNIVKNCSIDNNEEYGVYIQGDSRLSSSNRIYYNDFVDNMGDAEPDVPQAYDAIDKNMWDDQVKPNPPSGMGNYWSNYDGEDSNEDGIGDTPYTIDGPAENTDRFPVMDPFGWFD